MSIRKRNSIAFAAFYASAYYITSTLLGPVSFGVLNLRFANILLGLVPIFGMPAVIGQTLGVFFTNITSPLGPLDIANTLPSFICSWIIVKLRDVSVILGLLIYTTVLGTTVSLLISYVLNLPFLPTFLSVTAGIGVVAVVAAYILYMALVRVGVQRYVH
jgi:uncharacterized membrane protein